MKVTRKPNKATTLERLYYVFYGSSEAFVCCCCCSREIDWNDCAALEGLNKPFHCSLWHSLNPTSSEATVCNWFPFSLKHFNRKSEAMLILFVKLGGCGDLSLADVYLNHMVPGVTVNTFPQFKGKSGTFLDANKQNWDIWCWQRATLLHFDNIFDSFFFFASPAANKTQC